MNRRYLYSSLICVMLLIWMMGSGTSINDYIKEVKRQPIPLDTFGLAEGEAIPAFAPAAAAGDRSGLLEQIRAEAAKQRIAPINAKVDRVWKAIPGYNGLEVDVEQTYRLALQMKENDSIPFVYREIPPAISLDDLGPYPIYKGNPHKPMVSLMINVAWGEQFLPSIIETLNKENVHATFFFDGSWLSKHLELAKQIGQYGHELSNHAFSHPNMSRLSREQAKQEIVKTEGLLEQIGVKNKLFAPPSGDFDDETVALAHELRLKTVLWTIDTLDWKNPSPQTIVRKIADRVEPGSMILMHPTQASSLALDAMIKEIKKKGLVLGTVSELLSPERIPDADSGFGRQINRNKQL